MVRAQFAHLKADEKAIAERFERNALLVGEYVYDVHLDVPEIRFPAHWTKKDVETWSDLRAKRIDLVVKQPTGHWVLEITPKLSKAAIGGVLAYRDLYQKQYSPGVPVHVGVVCELDDPAYHGILRKEIIRLWVV